MKTILITISKDAIRRNILETDFLPAFLEHAPNTKIVLVVEKAQVDTYEKYAAEEHIIVEGYEKIFRRSLYARLLNFLIRTSVDSHSTRTFRNRAYQRGDTSLWSHLLKGCIANTLGRVSLFKRFLRVLFGKTTMPPEVYALLEKYKPDMVFAPSLIDHEFDVVFGAAAKQKGIHLVGMVRSWDNLNNHGVLAVVPDYFLFQNDFLIDAAQKFQGIDVTRLRKDKVGLPHYDAYFDPKEQIKHREVFFEELGLDPKKRMVLLGGSDFYYSEDVLPEILDAAIEAGEINDPLQIVFRPHPSSLFQKEDYGLERLKHVTLDDAFSGKVKFSDADKFINLVYHADIVINIASTLSIDAAVFRTPAICIGFDDPNRTLSYYEHVGRLYGHFDHYEALVATGGVTVAKSKEELIDSMNAYLRDGSLHEEGREAIVERFVAPFDGKASERLGACVAKELV